MLTIEQARQDLIALQTVNPFERMIQTAAIITQLLEQDGLQAIVVGGLSMEIYTMGGYTTQDIDFVLSGYEHAIQILDQLGFTSVGKDRIHKELGLSVEIPDNHLAGDPQRITRIEWAGRHVYVIGVEDLLMDRLRAAVHWKSASDREWGYRLMFIYRDEIDWEYLQTVCTDPLERAELITWMDQVKNID